MHEWDTAPWAARAAANGWDVQEIDGHDLDQIDAAYAAALASAKPAVIFARTKKGSGVAAVEDKEGWHGKPLEDPEAAVAELGGERSLRIEVSPPEAAAPAYEIAKEAVERPSYEVGEKVATRGAYGDALAWLGSIDERVVALDGEVGNSTYAERFGAKHPDRFFEMYIAEQQMIAAAVGMQTRGWKPFASSFGAFLSRAYDFIRMAAFSEADLKLCGSHVGDLDRARRSLADGARRHRLAAGRARQRRPLSLGPEPDRRPARRDARAPWDQLHADDPRRAADAV